MDTPTAQELKAFAENLGMSISTLINVFAKQILRTGEITLKKDLYPTPYLEEVIKQADLDRKNGDVSTFTTNEDALAHLDSLMAKRT
jgi:antitoxin component of RelBE/YafQ-DinJ toxin-antitoxin module